MLFWEWNGTLEQIKALTYPAGYKFKIQYMEVLDIAGRKALKMSVYERVGGGGDLAPGFTIYLPQKETKKYTVTRDIYFDPQGSYKDEWFSLDESVGYTYKQEYLASLGMKPFEPWASGHLIWVEPLHSHIIYRRFPTDNRFYGADTPFNLVRGKWINWKTEYVISETEGLVRHWFDDKKAVEVGNICTDPRNALDSEGVYMHQNFRHYAGNNLDFPQWMAYSNMKIFVNDLEIVPEPPIEPPVPEPEPTPPPTTRTLVAQALPYPLLLAKLWTLRKRFIREDIHRKVHPFI